VRTLLAQAKTNAPYAQVDEWGLRKGAGSTL